MTLSPTDLDRFASHTTIDITTWGRRSGRPRRIEIWWFRVDGRFIITGTPGPRDWLANLRADPRIIVHVDGHDVEATATEIRDEGFRRRIFTRPHTSWYRTQEELQRLIDTAPAIEVHLRREVPRSRNST